MIASHSASSADLDRRPGCGPCISTLLLGLLCRLRLQPPNGTERLPGHPSHTRDPRTTPCMGLGMALAACCQPLCSQRHPSRSAHFQQKPPMIQTLITNTQTTATTMSITPHVLRSPQMRDSTLLPPQHSLYRPQQQVGAEYCMAWGQACGFVHGGSSAAGAGASRSSSGGARLVAGLALSCVHSLSSWCKGPQMQDHRGPQMQDPAQLTVLGE